MAQTSTTAIANPAPLKEEPRDLLREKIDDPLWLAERLYFKLLREAADDAEASQ